MAPDAGGGVGAKHAPRRKLPVVIAPSSGDAWNVLAPPPVPLACWRLEDVRFDFDSSFIKPDAAPELTQLATLWKELDGPPLSVFGHADPVGDDEYNKTLSGRRATSVYALLTRNVDLWEQLYASPWGDDNWQRGALQTMSDTSGASGARKDVYRAYMDAICKDADGNPWSVEPSQFLARGADAGGKGDYQGCSEFNPILVFSRDEDAQLAQDKPERNRQNQPNRRVLVFLFPPGLHLDDPSLWPCPRAKENTSGCRAHFWPDADTRRNPGDVRRTYEETHDTFACWFYDAMARMSPCEIMRKRVEIRLLDEEKRALTDIRYKLTVGELDVRENDSPDGWVREDGVLAPAQIQIEWAKKSDLAVSDGFYTYRTSFFLKVEDDAAPDETEAARRRLHNLGYLPDDDEMTHAITWFQRDWGLDTTGTLDDTTKAKLEDVHDRNLARGES
jgi:hypothetical protein